MAALYVIVAAFVVVTAGNAQKHKDDCAWANALQHPCPPAASPLPTAAGAAVLIGSDAALIVVCEGGVKPRIVPEAFGWGVYCAPKASAPTP